MTAPWHGDILCELFRRRDEFHLDDDLQARITPSTPSADTLRFLGMLILWKRPRHIFEFGSGLSTLFLARLQQALEPSSAFSVMSIDHSHRALGETRRALGTAAGVCLLHAPLAVTERSGRVFTTYHPSYTHQIPPDVRFDFVLVDGPPAFRYGREAPLYQLAPYLAPNAIIVLSDANREPEQEALRNWRAAWPAGFAMELFPDLKKGLAVLSIGDPGHIAQGVLVPLHETAPAGEGVIP